ncbi:MAG TPA: hypothetical protein VGI39_35890 [Polyangiaceae bacterium]|jgi:hypothetical protein
MRKLLFLGLATIVACSGAAPPGEISPPPGGAAGEDAGTGASSPTSDAGGAPIGVGAQDATAPVAASDAGSGGPGIDSGGGAAPGDASSGAVPTIPKPTGTCPTIVAGDVTFAPAGISPRVVTLSMASTAPKAPGPLVFYWYATGSSVQEVLYSLGTTLGGIESAGGLVAAPHADPNAGQFEWYAASGNTKQDDFLVADEVVACLAQAGRIDVSHIHSMGMSAGALQTTAMSYARSAYLASVTTYSGGIPSGLPAPAFEDPSNRFSALLFEGGTNDSAYGFDFQTATLNYRASLQGAGHFAALCDHGRGHMIPTDAAPSVWLFFQSNGFGTYPSPYANGLPSTFPSYCTIAADAGP